MTPFLDTNILLRHLLQDDPDRSPRATALMAEIERGDRAVRISDIVVFETVFTLQRRQRRAKAEIAASVLPLIEMRGVVLPGKARYRRAFDLYVRLNIAFADAFHTVLMEELGITEILSFDREFERPSGVTRLEP